MHCFYKITATSCPRLLARVLQLFDQQMLAPATLHFMRHGEETLIEIGVACEVALARRLVAKLYHLQSVQSVTLAPNDGREDANYTQTRHEAEADSA